MYVLVFVEGAPVTTDDGNPLIVEFVGEEQRSISKKYSMRHSLEEFVARQGAPQNTDDGNPLIVEFVGEEQRSIARNYSMSMASPKEKNLYSPLTAVS